MPGPVHVIVGAGQAGAWAAVAMRQAGFTGRIVLLGEEPWRPYERPPLSKTMLTAQPEPPISHFHTEARYAELKIDLHLDTVVESVEPEAHRIHLSRGGALDYDRLLLATGGQARRLPTHGGDRALTLRTLEDSWVLRARLGRAKHVLCIGGGVIGLEIASSARKRGCAVTVLEAMPRVMGRAVSPEGASFIEALHRENGVVLHTGVIVESIDDAPAGDNARSGRLRVTCRNGSAFDADLVIAGIGMQRNLALAEAAGLSLEGGIVVDQWGRTSAPDIYAAGDVTAFFHPLFKRRLRLESWRHAQNHGLAVGRAMCGGEAPPYDDVPWFWTEQHGVNLQVAGLPAEAARTIVIGDPFTAVHLAEDGCVIGVTAADNPREVRAGMAMIKARVPIDEAALADPRVLLQKLVPP